MYADAFQRLTHLELTVAATNDNGNSQWLFMFLFLAAGAAASAVASTAQRRDVLANVVV